MEFSRLLFRRAPTAKAALSASLANASSSQVKSTSIAMPVAPQVPEVKAPLATSTEAAAAVGSDWMHTSVPRVLSISWRKLLDYVRPKRVKLPLYGFVVTLPVEEPLEVPLTDIEGITEDSARERTRYRFLSYMRLVQVRHVSRDPTLLCAWWRLDAADSPAAEQLMQPKSVGISIRESEMEDLARTTLYTIQSFKKAFLPLETNPLTGTSIDRQRSASLVKATEILLSHSHLAEATRRIQTQQELLAEARNKPNPFTVKAAGPSTGGVATELQLPAISQGSSHSDSASTGTSISAGTASPVEPAWSRRPSTNHRKSPVMSHPAFKLMPMSSPHTKQTSSTATTKTAATDSEAGSKREKDPPSSGKATPVVPPASDSIDVMEL